jgi:hypothetical protein
MWRWFATVENVLRFGANAWRREALACGVGGAASAASVIVTIGHSHSLIRHELILSSALKLIFGE